MIECAPVMERLATVFKRFVDEVGVSGAEVIRRQGGLLCEDLVAKTGPRNLSKARRKAATQVRMNFYRQPRRPFTGTQKGSDPVWLYAHPKALVGVLPEYVHLDADVEKMARLHYASQPGAKWRTIGTRGPQEVMLIDKPLVTRSAFDALLERVQDRFGRMKASFAVGIDTLKANARIPAWVKKHIDRNEAPGAFINNLSDENNPSITIISHARGVESDYQKAVMQNAMERRVHAASKDLSRFWRDVKQKAGLN